MGAWCLAEETVDHVPDLARDIVGNSQIGKQGRQVDEQDDSRGNGLRRNSGGVLRAQESVILPTLSSRSEGHICQEGVPERIPLVSIRHRGEVSSS